MGSLTLATYQDIVRRPIYYIILLVLAAMIFLSQYVTLFSFYQEMNLVREMGMATITFFGFLVTVILSGILVTNELEDRTAVMLLSKPISRTAFLVGKFLGLILAVLPGVVVLSGVLFVTLWFMALPAVYGNDGFLWVLSHPEPGGGAPLPVLQDGASVGAETRGSLAVCWRYFVLTNGGVVLQGAALSYFQIVILAAIGVSLAAFFPVVVSAASTSLLFVLGNISSYMLAAVERWQIGAVSVVGRALYYLLPNLGYFNLQTYYGEGRMFSLRYLGFAAVYAASYSVAVFLVSCAAFRRREIR